jgi:DNA transformation protein
MAASDSFAEFPREQLAPLGRVSMRRMFGKTGVFCDGLMFGMVTDNMLYLRVDDHNRAAFKEAGSSPPLSYEKRGCTIDLAFWRAPQRLFDEPDALVAWARIALAAARRVAARRGENGQRQGENQSRNQHDPGPDTHRPNDAPFAPSASIMRSNNDVMTLHRTTRESAMT